VPDFIANKAFSVLQPAYNTYPRILSIRQGKSNEFFGEICFAVIRLPSMTYLSKK